ncbi:MAG: cysteine desulfurase family protein [Bryobacteraceae bacterium]|nr:cysteine desulfurase family protein [Bryobacteraceae bacterium]
MQAHMYYFDHNATTPIASPVLTVLTEALESVYGNASSIHRTGQEARGRLEAARKQVADLLGVSVKEIIFTSGGTEADNQAIFGVVRGAAGAARRHVVTTTIEHSAVLNCCGKLQREGVEVTYVPVGASGVVDPDDVRRAMRPETVLVSVMLANNELGTIQPVREIARMAREAGVPVHCDGVQATGKIPVSVRELGVDFFALSAHKLYGPKGAGALYVRQGVEFEPVLYGGRHEGGRRPGTENVPGGIGLGAAAAHAGSHLDVEQERLAKLRDRLEAGVLASVPDAHVNGAGSPRVPNTTNIRFDGIEGEAMVIALDLRGFCVSSGAACSSGAVEPSHVLTAIGLSKQDARSAVRFSLGQSNDERQVDELIGAVAECASHLRRLSPVYAGAR